MEERIGYWRCVERGYVREYDVCLKDGVLNVDWIRHAVVDRKAFKKDFGKRFFGDERFFLGCTDDFLERVLFECDGKDEVGITEVAKSYRDKREEFRQADAHRVEEWRKLRERFDGVVIGLDKKIDVYGSGFCVRVVFSSDVTFLGRRDFLKKNQDDFLRWVIKEISKSPSILRRIGSVEFYKPVEITNLRSCEVEVKFDVKEEIE